jgi:ABC-type multidrug transport system fused ATPase/permease subunit
VALARALYSRARILLLDDPLSALDHQTADTIVRKCFSGSIVKDRVVVLVTHRPRLVHSAASQFIEVSNGQLSITSADPFLENGKAVEQDDGSESASEEPKSQDQNTGGDDNASKFIEEEQRGEGAIKAKVWLAFVQAGKWWWTLLFAMMALTRVANVAQTWFFKLWGEAYGQSGLPKQQLQDIYHTAIAPLISLNPGHYLPSPNDNLKPWLVVLLIVSVIQASALALYACSQLTAVYATSKVMFEKAMYRVTTASFRYYDVTPVGRIMNRLTSDIQTLDSALNYFGTTIFYFSLFISSIIVIASVSPMFLLFSGALMGMFVIAFQQFLPASRSLKRLETASLSPIYSVFSELLQDQGLITARAFHVQKPFHDRIVSAIDNYQGFAHFYSSVQNWLMIRYEIISSISIFVITVFALATELSPGLTAFMLLNANSFITATHILCIRFGDLQTEFISVERLVDLMEIPQEPLGDVKPPASWPQYGSDIVFDHVTIKYAPDLSPALKDISLHIRGGSTTAIIGRSGSGKSTLASAVLNIVRPESGSISIDKIPLTDVDVRALRHRITFVPQDPVLFLGTIRQNLDPVDEFTDDECEAVLSRVCTKFLGQAWTLQTRVESGGRNLSQGQRQLVGIARAVLRRSPIVILDEATASIDIATSIELQHILRDELKEVTMIVIAHRVEAVEDADYHVVLQDGCVVEQAQRAKRVSSVNESTA